MNNIKNTEDKLSLIMTDVKKWMMLKNIIKLEYLIVSKKIGKESRYIFVL